MLPIIIELLIQAGLMSNTTNVVVIDTTNF
jgi:hypothetical protein